VYTDPNYDVNATPQEIGLFTGESAAIWRKMLRLNFFNDAI
jgi:hypothetical protein